MHMVGKYPMQLCAFNGSIFSAIQQLWLPSLPSFLILELLTPRGYKVAYR